MVQNFIVRYIHLMSISLDVEHAVASRYSDAAQTQVPELCCPVTYDPQYLQIIPDEIKERDYGCGNPSEFVREGDRVLDLGSGGGKICYIAAQIVGPKGRVIGVDMNDEMLALAEKYRGAISEKLGYSNVEFHKGRIQELSPLLAEKSVDVVLSNCVLNLVRPEDKNQLFAEMFRVVADGGRVAISDIVSDVDVPEELQRNPELWSGCISGAFREDKFLKAFVTAGFHQAKIVKRDETPWRVEQGIEFRAVTVLAFKDEAGAQAEPCCCS